MAKPKPKPYVFDLEAAMGHLSLMISIVRALEKKNEPLPTSLLRCVASAERFVADADKYLSNWSGT